MLLSVEIFDVTFPLVKKCRTVSTFFFPLFIVDKAPRWRARGKIFYENGSRMYFQFYL